MLCAPQLGAWPLAAPCQARRLTSTFDVRSYRLPRAPCAALAASRRAPLRRSCRSSSQEQDGLLPLARQVSVVALPNIGSFFLQLLNEQTNVIMLGQTGSDASLAAVGLGNMMQNCCGLSIGWGLLGALDTLVSQAHGARQQDAACMHFQRGRIIATLQLLWIIPLLLCTEPLLVALGQEAQVSHLAAAYNRASAPALFCLFQYQAAAKFLQNQCVTAPPLLINLCCSLLHVCWCALFVAWFKLGNAGAGYANVATWTCQWIFISLYLLRAGPARGLTRRALLAPTQGCLKGWGNYLKVAIPCLLQTSSEWWFWEICALVVGYLGTVPLAAHVAASQFVALAFMPAIGISSAAAALVGNALGAGKPRRARKLVGLCLALNLGVWTAIATCIFAGHRFIAGVYVPPGEVSRLMQVLLMIYAVAGFFDTTQNAMSGALRGMGKTTVTSAVYLIAYYGLMLPVGCALAFHYHWGVQGIWYAFVIGTSAAVAVFGAILGRTRFGPLAAKISATLQ